MDLSCIIFLFLMNSFFVTAKKKKKKKFNVDGAARGKPRPSRNGGVFCNSGGVTFLFFSELVGVRDSNEAELLGIRGALVLWVGCGKGKLIVEGDLVNAIKWATGCKRPPWKLVLVVREIRALCSGRDASFVRVRRPVNGVTDFLMKIGVDREHDSVFFC